MPNFKKQEADLKTRLDKWLYFIKHLEDFQSIPTVFKDEVFTQAFEKAELAKFGQAELDNYEYSLKTYRDLKGVIDTAFDEGKIKGKIEVAKKMKLKGLSSSDIADLTGLTQSEIDNF
jgi:predicted transposase/invertase (TIGR01784 family)